MNSDFSDFGNVRTNEKVENEIRNIDKSEYNKLFRNKDKSDRATVEQVIDSRISRMLYKLINKGELVEIQGCISTGKEANVYYAKGPSEKELAIKIYKTSTLIFKDRERYIAGEFRFRHGYCKGNPRKMVAIWAEKEVRNLKRLILAGINCPTPLVLKSSLIVMEFIGKDEVAAPRLKDADITQEQFEVVYVEVVNIMRTMFKSCKLVHADFSEYNILYYEDKVYIIDVGQAVECDHINAFSFLKRDCHNINMFFERKGVDTLTDKQLFEIVSTFHLKNTISDIISKSRQDNEEKSNQDCKYKEKENGLFSNFEIPKGLMEEDLDKITGNADIEEALTKICGIVNTKDEEDSDDSYEEDEDEANDDQIIKEDVPEDEALNSENIKKKKFDPFEGLSKTERQRKVKDDNRDKRTNKKFSKAEKDKLVKKTSGKKK